MSSDRVSRAMKLRPSPSMVVALLSLFVALSGVSYAAVKLKANAVKTRNIKNKAVTGPKIGPNAVDASKVGDGTLTNADLAASARFSTQFDAAPAGGDLTGTFPAPLLGPNSVGSAEIAPDSVAASEITAGAVGVSELAASIPTARVTSTAALEQSTNSFNTLAFNSERYDVGSMHSNSTNNSRLTAPADGIYLVTAHVEWESNTTGTRTLTIRKNDVGAGTIARQEAPGDGLTGLSIATAVQLADNDFVEVEVRQDSGGDLDVNKSGEQSPEFSLTWLAPGPPIP